MCKYRVRCKFRQFLPNKHDKYCLKCWKIADARNYYPLNEEVYTGENLSNKPEDITLRLATVLNPWHIIVGDNLFTSLSLSYRLLI